VTTVTATRTAQTAQTAHTRVPLPGEPVRIYRNLHADCWSVQQRVRQETTRGFRHVWRVVCHTDAAVLTNVAFKVYERGRQQVLKTGHKNVHAYAYGVWAEDQTPEPEVPHFQVEYNPRRHRTFVAFRGEQQDFVAVHGCQRAWLDEHGNVYGTHR